MPIVLNDRTAVSIRTERHVVSGAMLDLQLGGTLEQRLRDAGQAGAAITLGGVESRAVGVILTVNLEGLVD